MNGSPLSGILCDVRGLDDEVPSGAPTRGGEGIRVTPLTSSACRLGRASATTGSEESAGGRPRRNTGRSGSPESRGAAEDEDVVAESPGAISALGVPSAFETARRIRGRSLSSLLLEELLDGLLLDALLVAVSELELARRSLGRSGSLSPDELFELDELFEDDELPDELPTVSSELELARRSLGRSPLLLDEPLEALLELPEELSEELFDPADLPVIGCDVSSTA